MPGLGPIGGNLTNADIRHAFFLTLAFILILSSRLCQAAENYSEAEKIRISEVENYVRKESLQGVSLLPGEMRTAVGWFSGHWHAMPLLGGVDEETLPPEAQNLTGETMPPEEQIPVNLAGNFHHKGFLPIHDAMVMGVGFGRSAFDNKLQFTAHPFYGQNWRSLQGYWGAEGTIDIAQRADGLPWGKISLGYIDGNESLTDHGRGIDLHGDVDLTNGWKFTSGMRQNSADGSSNYVLLKWKLDFD
jgi:hypothetical protein